MFMQDVNVIQTYMTDRTDCAFVFSMKSGIYIE